MRCYVKKKKNLPFSITIKKTFYIKTICFKISSLPLYIPKLLCLHQWDTIINIDHVDNCFADQNLSQLNHGGYFYIYKIVYINIIIFKGKWKLNAEAIIKHLLS